MARADPDWYAFQRDLLCQLSFLCGKHRAPLVLAGDLFDDGWRPLRCPPALINLALEGLPCPTYALPGQHDLPLHRYEDLYKSALWALVAAGRVTLIPPCATEGHLGTNELTLWGFPWGFPPRPCTEPRHDLDGRPRLAVVHHYVWKSGTGHAAAGANDRVGKIAPLLEGYDVALCGDNHVPFEYRFRHHSCLLFNAGGLMRRRSDERDHRPSVGLLRADGSVDREYLDCSADQFADDCGEAGRAPLDVRELLEELDQLGEQGLDFESALEGALLAYPGDNRDRVRDLVVRALGGEP